MLQLLREETEGKLQVLLSHRKNGLAPLFKEVRVFNLVTHSTAICDGVAAIPALLRRRGKH